MIAPTNLTPGAYRGLSGPDRYLVGLKADEAIFVAVGPGPTGAPVTLSTLQACSRAAFAHWAVAKIEAPAPAGLPQPA